MSDATRAIGGASRRQFLRGLGAGAVAGSAALAGLSRAADVPTSLNPNSAIFLGQGPHKYELVRDWAKLPADVKLGNTHGVQVDAQGRVFVHHTGTPSMLVFDRDGKLIKSWGPQYAVAAHGLQLRKEGGQEFLYLALTGQHRVVKATLDGEVVLTLGCPKECEAYADDKKYVPTNVAFAPNGDFYVADGYGQSCIHQYKINGEYIRSWGGKGSEPGKMQCCHGIHCDTRGGADAAELVVADRENHRLQYFSLDGRHLRFVQGSAKDEGLLRRPCHFDQRGTDLLIPDLRGRVTILDKDNQVVTHLGDNSDPSKRANNGVPPEQWIDGQFCCPHGACWDHDGNAIIVEWLKPGRITMLRRVV